MIIENPYIADCDSSTFSVLFHQFNWKKDIKLVHALIKYPQWRPNIDFFRYIEEKNEIRNDPRCYLVFDASTEGFCPFKNFFFDNLYESCRLNNIPADKVIFVSTNMKDHENLKIYNTRKNVKNSLKIFTFLSFKKMIQDLIEDNYGFDFESDRAFDYFYKKCQEQYKGIFGLSLSRVNREHRTLAHFMIHQKGLSSFFNISQDALSSEDIKHTKKHFNLNDDFNEWAKQLPLTVDTNDFKTNHALTLNSHLHNSTLFQIVNETHVKDWNNSSLFFSEKTFRSIAHMQPFLIFGQPGCNHILESFGFKLFRDEFDYTFDKIKDTKKRYESLLNTCNNLCNKLKKMTLQEQIDWRFSQRDILKHNYNLVMDIKYYEKDFIQLIEHL